MKKIKIYLLSFFLLCSLIPSHVLQAEETNPEDSYLINTDFENDIWGDTDWGWNKNVGDWGSDGNVTLTWNGNAESVYEGSHSLSYWSAIENDMDIFQEVTLPAGDYEFTAWCMGEKSLPVLYCSATEATTEVSLGGWQNWKKASLNFSLDEETSVKVGIKITLEADGWGYIDKCSLSKVEEVDPDDPPLPTKDPAKKIELEPIEGLSEDFMRGVDISTLISLEQAGVTFYDTKGYEADMFDILEDAGVNWIRVRIWNDPYDSEGHGYGGGNTDLKNALEIGRRCKTHNMHLYLNLHYSDFWTNPAIQKLPKAWEGYNLDQLAEAIYSYTTDTLNAFKAEDIPVDMVQIGNETSNYFCGTHNDWSKISRLLSSGCKAVKDFNPVIKTVIHFDKGGKGNYFSYMEELAKNHCEYDYLGLSWYPFYDDGSLDDLLQCMNSVVSKYNKEIIIVENSYATTFDDSDGHPDVFGDDYYFKADNFEKMKNWEISPQGQAKEVRDVIETLHKVSDHKGIGYFYWEPAWITVGDTSHLTGNAWETRFTANKALWNEFGCGWASEYMKSYRPEEAQFWGGSSWDNQAMFAPDGQAYDSINVFRYIFSGNETEESSEETKVVSYEAPSVTLNISSNLNEDAIWQQIWKNQVKCTLANGNVENISILRWVQTNCEAMIKAYKEKRPGDYIIPGILNDEHHSAVSMKVTIIGDISCIKGVSLNQTSFAYDGGVKTPTVKVVDIYGNVLKEGSDYTVTYPTGRSAIGRYVVSINGCGYYQFLSNLIFEIDPKPTTISKLSAGKKKLTVKIKKMTTQTSGYQIQYSTSKDFSTARATLIKKNKTTKKTIKKLKKGKRYYVRVRTYKTVNGENFFSTWSNVKSKVVK